MNVRVFLLALVWLISPALAGAGNAGPVTVTFEDADRFTDVGVTRRERERNLDVIERSLVDHVTACVGSEDRVEIRVLDVRLAGRYEWWRSPQGMRMMGPADWPRLKLEYQWQGADGTTVAERRESVEDRSYLRRAGLRHNRPLPHEDRMIRHWARDRFCRVTE